ncbi:MAG: RnfABCDGE type electron transport complex subunit D [Deltaproteobacteria bacterium]|nr:RnfABCDGE type electron transport complex subunit D [Deltaproteobacteria bacterium]MBI3293653.1 RnfABCDGE type electron transport complex subunit D [Deltaproteobacteria bacterium]
MADPRVFQIGFLSLLLVFGVVARDFGVSWGAVALVMGVVFAIQGIAVGLRRAPIESLYSAVISGLSVLLLGRAQSVALLCLAAALAIASKFAIRWKGKHFFNPTNFGILVTILLMGQMWVSPGQWGSDLLIAGWVGVLGLVVVVRSARWDTAFVFLGAYAFFLAIRVWHLGQSWAVLQHQLSSGTLIVFAFFMISDPRSTPDDRRARAAFAVGVAALSYHLRFFHQVSAAPLWALLFLSPLTPVLDRIWPHRRHEWGSSTVYLARGILRGRIG